MARAAEEFQWMARMGGLTATPADNWDPHTVDRARTTAMTLVALARELRADGAGGAPGDLNQEDFTRLIHLLAEVALPAPPPPATGDTAGDRFVRVLAEEAGTAVYVCRTVLHRSGACLFEPPAPAAPVCGRVLTAAHKVRSR